MWKKKIRFDRLFWQSSSVHCTAFPTPCSYCISLWGKFIKNVTVIFIFNFMIVNNVKEKKSVPQIDPSPVPTALKKIVSRIFSEILSQCAVLSAFWCWQMLFPWGHPVTFEQEQQQPRVRANGLNLNNIRTYVWGCMMCTTSLY